MLVGLKLGVGSAALCGVGRVAGRRLQIAGSLLLVWLIIGITLGEDRVQPRQGVPVSGTLESVSRDGVQIRTRAGNLQTINAWQIAFVAFDREPTALTRAKEQASTEAYQQAADELAKVDTAQLASAAARTDYRFYQVFLAGQLALQGGGEIAAAAEALEQFGRENRDLHHYFPMVRLIAQLAELQGEEAKATRFYQSFGQAEHEPWRSEAIYRQAELARRQGDLAAARQGFDDLLARGTTGPESQPWRALAEVGRIRSQMGPDQWEASLKELRQLVERTDMEQRVVMAHLFNAQAVCLVELGRIDEAVLAYLHTDLLFSGEAATHAEALYHLSSLWPKVGQPQRGAEARARLQSEYPPLAAKWR
jgi:tetratricopeptide (TPR) repeat protein